ncbi:hypothetical protein BGX38DRAFT_1201068 [Terfezia claveryi]|nr:hypothetical protein BGX38DRAFT_1201068 [Terfezia claveryi]
MPLHPSHRHQRQNRPFPGDRLPGQNLPHVPRPLTSRDLPLKYKAAERRVRTVIIAVPIALMTSWVLWKRFVLGEKRKSLGAAPPQLSPRKGRDQ